METQEAFKVHHPVFQEQDLLQTMIDALVHHLPLLGEDHIVLLYRVLDYVGRGQHLLSTLLGVSFDPTDLSSMGSPFTLSVVHLTR